MKPFILAFAMLSASAQAAISDGNYLLSKINGIDVEKTYAYGYVTGVWDSATALKLICAPVGVTVGQATAIVQQWLTVNPAQRHKSGADVVFLALNEVFPCAKPEKPTKGQSL